MFTGEIPAVAGSAYGFLPADAGSAAGDYFHLDLDGGVDPVHGAYGRFDLIHLNPKNGNLITNLHGRIQCIKTSGKDAFVSAVISNGDLVFRPEFDPAGRKAAITIKDNGGKPTFAVDLDYVPPAHAIADCQPVTENVVSVVQGNFVVR